MSVLSDQSPFEARVRRKVTWRIIPFMFVLYLVSYIDRANIGYAALQMNQELALSSEAFGLVSGIFFLGYFLFEVPSNLALARVGARRWIARILISWGLVAALTALVQNATQLYVLRFLLGVAEAGFFPGIIVYLTQWFRPRDLAGTIALFMVAIPVSYVVGAPLSTAIMGHVHWFGFSGWRWMLFLEGLPALAMGLACYRWLTDSPQQATWLTQAERSWLVETLRSEQPGAAPAHGAGLRQALASGRVWCLSAIYFVYQCGSHGTGYWMPQIIQAFSASLSMAQIGLTAMLPYILATAGMIAWSRHSDRSGERQLHAALPLLMAALCMGGAGTVATPLLALLLISVALTSLYASKAPFWTMASQAVPACSTVVSIAVINSLGNLGGFAGPFVIGLIKGATGSARAGLLFLAVLLAMAFGLTLCLRLAKPASRQRNGRTRSCRD